MATAEQALPLEGRDRLTIALVGLAHAVSHFFQLVLPPLFPFLILDFAVSYTELGALMSLFFVVSGFGQPVAGFLVDRLGARKVLFLGLAAYSLCIMLLAALSAFWMLFPVMAVAAVGNCIFHPVDYTILNASVRHTHVGRAFAVHTLGGNLGWVAAPVLMLGIAGIAGWRVSVFAAGLAGAIVWITLWLHRDLLRDEREARAQSAGTATGFDARVLRSLVVLLCFAYFALLAAAQIGVQNFIGPILAALQGISVAVAGTVLTAFLLGASAGVIAGGVTADRTTSHSRIIILGLAGAGLSVVLTGHVPAFDALLIGLMAMAGFLSGMTSPSRDMLVRRATPPGATGRVFGFVYSGLDVGSAIAPVSVGALLDHDRPETALWAIGGMLVLAIFTVAGIAGTRSGRPAARKTAEPFVR